MSERSRTQVTYHYELLRASTAGVLESASGTFLLLVALRWYGAGASAKAFIAAGGSLGLLLSPVVVEMTTRWQVAPSRAASMILAFGSSLFLVAAIYPTFPVYVFCSVAGMATSAAIIPLLTQMYQENYPENQRGRLFSKTIMLRIASTAAFSKVAGDWLTLHLQSFPFLLGIFGASLALASFCLWQCPTYPIPVDDSAHPLRSLRFIKEDAIFRRTLICWMLMGFANLMMIPLRVEYLGNPKYNQHLTVATIALLTGVIPNLARLALSPVWGHLFDHMNFFALRVTLNIGFAIGILAFFTTHSLAGMICGAVVFGISNAGGDVAWSLWVTKFAPPERVADYMAIHTGLTGLRGVLAPMVAFYMVTRLSLGTLALISTGLIVLATMLLIPEIRIGAKGRAKPALTEEVSD
jgi:MFS family permease